MDALLIIIAIVYAIASSFSKSNKAKKQSQARKKAQRPAQSFEQMMAEEFAKPKNKQQSTMLEVPQTTVKAPKKKKKKAPSVLIEQDNQGRKAPLRPTSRAEHDHAHKAAITPTKREEHEHEHKAPLKSRLNNRSYAGIKSKYQSSPLEVQILAESSAQTPHAAGFKLKTDPEALIEGIVWNEVLAKPKGLRR